jgi:hypothetical protein|tara:strand:- start:71 stop:778 length:708 start_codon:yes stop_codon:yes gene_type:complete
MPDLNELKTRLLKLPDRRLENKYADRFRQYTQKLGESREKIKKAYKDMTNASKVNSNCEYESKVLPELKRAVREAKKLHKEISEEPKKVMLKATENGITRIGENAGAALKLNAKIWEQEMMSIVTEWEKIANVVQILVPDKGEGFKQVVDRLRGQEIPQNDEEVGQIKTDIEELKSCIKDSKIEDETPFVEFLRSTVDGGVSLSVLSKGNPHSDEIIKKLEELDLWDSFRIRFIG